MPPPESSEALSPTAAAFAEFLEQHEAGGAPDFEAFCAEHAGLAPGLRRLHARWNEMQRALEGLGAAGAPPSPEAATEELLGRLRGRIGGDTPQPRYEARGELARGGMGTVLEVWDAELRRSLAMKVLSGGTPPRVAPRQLARFLEEAQITGQLEHPGIVPVHELGLDGEGRVYFTMPLVRGRSLEDIARRVDAGDAEWSLPRALGVLVRVCEAVGYAHAKGVIHRDLKPANVMVGAFGETYVVDWGLARVLGTPAQAEGDVAPVETVRKGAADSDASPLSTMAGDIVGTPAYMPPEQAHGRIEELGPTSDVYAIGAMLYRLLAGHRPYLAPGDSQSAEGVLRAVKSHPPRPLQKLAPDVPPELVAITEKAMARAPEARYRSTMDLGRDLRAFLEGRVVRAYERGAWAELRKWMGRNRRFAAASLIALVAVIGGLVASSVLGLRAADSAQQLATELAANNVERGRLLGRVGPLSTAEELLWREFLKRPRERHARWALWELYAHHPCVLSLRAAANGSTYVAFLPGGELVTLTDDGALRVWPPGGHTALREQAAHGLDADGGGAGARVVGTPDGAHLVTGGAADGRVCVWRADDLSPVGAVQAHAAGVFDLDVDSGGTRIATTGSDGALRLWRLADLAPLGAIALGEGETQGVRFAPDGAHVAVATAAGRVRLVACDESGLAEVARAWDAHDERPSIHLDFTADGDGLVSGSRGRELRAWSLADDEVPPRPPGSNGTVRAVRALPGQDTLVSVGWYELIFHDPETLDARAAYALPHAAVDTAVSPDGRLLAVGLQRGDVRLFELPSSSGVRAVPGDAERSVVAFHPDGRSVAFGDEHGAVGFHDPISGAPVRRLQAHGARVTGIGFTANGARLWTQAEDGSAAVRRTDDGEVLLALDGIDLATGRGVALSADGALLAAPVPGGLARLHRVPSGEVLAEVRHGEAYQVLSNAFVHAPGRDPIWLTAGRDYELRRWSLTGEPLGSVRAAATPWTLAPTADGRVALGGWSHRLEVLGRGAEAMERSLVGHRGTVWDAVLHPTDADLAATCADDGTVRLWDLREGRTLVTFDVSEELGGFANSVEFSPDGRTLAVGGGGVPLLIDLEHYDRHVAGNARVWMERLEDELGELLDRGAVEAWLAEVEARAWPRLHGFGTEAALRAGSETETTEAPDGR